MALFSQLCPNTWLRLMLAWEYTRVTFGSRPSTDLNSSLFSCYPGWPVMPPLPQNCLQPSVKES